LSSLKRNVFTGPLEYEAIEVLAEDKEQSLPEWWVMLDIPEALFDRVEEKWCELNRWAAPFFVMIKQAERDMKESLEELELHGRDWLQQNCAPPYGAYGGGAVYLFSTDFLMYRLGHAVMTLKLVDPAKSDCLKLPEGWTYGDEGEYRIMGMYRDVNVRDPEWDFFVKVMKTWIKSVTSQWDRGSMVYRYHAARFARERLTSYVSQALNKFHHRIARTQMMAGARA
jgi:hypothetical protein